MDFSEKFHFFYLKIDFDIESKKRHWSTLILEKKIDIDIDFEKKIDIDIDFESFFRALLLSEINRKNVVG